MLKVAIYGKGGIGKSTVTSNLAAAFASMGKKVIQIGCDPKADSTINLLGGEPLRPVMNYMREEDEEPERLEDISKEGFGGVLCIETGGPTPGLGCAGRGIIATFQLLEDLRLFETYQPDVVLYDVLGDAYHDAIVIAGKDEELYQLWKDRLEYILHEFSGFGWGMGDYITEEYYSLPWIEEE